MMRLNRWFGIIGVCLSFAIVSCDEIEDPYADRDDIIYETGDPLYNDTVYNDTSQTTRRILIEDFTGHKCPNCPAAAESATQLMTDNPNDVVAVAIHNSGAFSEVDLPDYPADFETETGEKLRNHFQIGSFPNGLINRTEWNGSYIVGHQLWENQINTLTQDPSYMAQRFRVKLMNIYNSDTRILRVIPDIEVVQNQTGNFYFVIYITESHIVSGQIDNRLSPSYVPDYENNHVLRTGFPQDGDGRLIFTNPNIGEQYIVAEDSEDEYRLVIDESWNAENLEVICFIVNDDTEEIMQVEEMHLLSGE